MRDRYFVGTVVPAVPLLKLPPYALILYEDDYMHALEELGRLGLQKAWEHIYRNRARVWAVTTKGMGCPYGVKSPEAKASLLVGAYAHIKPVPQEVFRVEVFEKLGFSPSP